MATLERIRRRSGLLIIVIGVAMAAFILTDLLGSGDSILRNNANNVGEVNGREIDIRDFNAKVDERLTLLQQQNPENAQNISRVQVAEQIWREFLQEEILGSSYEELGISVTANELFDRIAENSMIQQQPAFKDPNTGRFSPAALKQYIQSIQDNSLNDEQAAQALRQWVTFEEGTKDQVLQDKYLYAVRKGIYMPSILAQTDYLRRNENSAINYIGLELNTIADTAVSYSESDLKAYYRDHRNQFATEATRDLAFVRFEVEASQADRDQLYAELESYLSEQIINVRGNQDTLPSFYNASNDSSFAVGRSDTRVEAAYLLQDQIDSPLDTLLFAQSPGYIHGPYEDGLYMALTKISDERELPDSVSARHILISYQGANEGQSSATRAPQEALAMADSLLDLVKGDSTLFSELAKQWSDDPSSGNQGGNLGWFSRGQMVASFDRFSFFNAKGTIGMVESRFGLHIIQILDRAGSNRALKLVHIRREIEPSDATRDSIYNLASAFASEVTEGDFGTIAEQKNLVARPANDLAALDEMILGLGQNREIIRWAHNEDSKQGAIQLFNHNNQDYVVAQLVAQREEGFASFEQVREQIVDAVIDEKKRELLSQRMAEAAKGATNVNEVAQNLGLSPKSQALNFGTSNLSGFGSEPKVIGRASVLPTNQLSSPIKGDRGVYLVEVNNRSAAEGLPDYQSERVQKEIAMQNEAAAKVFESLKDGAKIVDNRARFY